MHKSREKWVDDVKTFACILVALGHFFQSMIHAGILQESIAYNWFNRTIYYFHVPLFFLCSGYLYQKKTGTGRWVENVTRKGISLGIPYVVFSTATWLLKEVFSGSVNTQNVGLAETLLLSPASPYWYLYTLFFLFVVTPRFGSGRAAAIGGLCAVFLKGLRLFGLVETGIYAIDSVMDNGLWFVLGMLLRFYRIGGTQNSGKQLAAGAGSFAAFLAISLLICLKDIHSPLLPLLMGLWGCSAVVLTLRNWNMNAKLRWLADMLAGYTMPVFLMHTIFAAGLRAVLLKLGIASPAIHVLSGIAVSFLGPIAAAFVMERIKLDFLVYPGKYLNSVKFKESDHV